MMSSAQRALVGEDEDGEFRLVAPAAAELKAEVAAKLAAHRRRRAGSEEVSSMSENREMGHPDLRQQAIAAAVAERYARTPSYRAVLAEQARRGAEEAAARAEVAQRHAVAAAAVQQELLGELELWDAPQEFSRETAGVVEAVLPEVEVGPPMPQKRDLSTGSGQAMGHTDGGVVGQPGGLTVRLYEDLGAPMSGAWRVGGMQVTPDTEEARALDAEIAFRKAPVFEQHQRPWDEGANLEAPEGLPANLLEFPRQLVATRKARPRLAEGPLRDEAPRTSQLRIFEVEPEQISTAPAAAAAPDWSMSIRLDAHTSRTAAVSETASTAPSLPLPQTAPAALRAMAGLVDGGLVLLALVAFAAAFAEVAGRVPAGAAAGMTLAGVGAALWFLYQALFFYLSEQTPGMRYAKIGLCTLSDENPTRAAMRRRIGAQALALCPLGLGVLWSLLDEDGLGWHDRLSRMYPRAY